MTINNDDLYLVLNTIGIGKISITEFESLNSGLSSYIQYILSLIDELPYPHS